MKKILLYSVYRETISLKKESFTVYRGWNETYKLLSHSLEEQFAYINNKTKERDYKIRAGKIFIRQNVLFKGAQKNPYSSNHLQKHTLDFGKKIFKNLLNL